jgi:hypothetical protein
MPATYEKIATTTLGSAAASIDFTSISSAYTDLRLVLVCTTSISRTLWMRFNSDSGTNYSTTSLLGDGFSAASYRTTSVSRIEVTDANTIGTDTTIPELYTVDLFSYAGSTFKTVLTTGSKDRNGSGEALRKVGLYRSTSAVNEINILLNTTGNFNTGTTATLYGILKA